MTAHAKRSTTTKTAGTPWLTCVAALGVIALAGIRALTTFLPDVHWAADPRAGAGLDIGFGPTGAAIIDWLCVATLALAVIDSVLRRDRVHVVLLILWLVGAGFVLWHGGRDFESLRIGGHWLGAIALGLAAMHVAQAPPVRRFLIAACIAMIVPIAGAGLFQVTIAHAETVASYEKDPDAVLRAQGITPGSVNHRKFEERMYQVEATGAFGFSNVYGSIAMTLTLLGAGVTIALLLRDGARGDGTAWLAVGVTLLGVAALGMTFSKGATLAFGAASAATAVTLLVSRLLNWGAAWWRTAGFGAVALGLAAIMVRGAIGEPPTAAGERSLLFRYHYLQASARIAVEHPVAGVGPGLYKAHYLSAKNPLSPEDVADPHNVLASYVSTLGVGGTAWAALLATLLWYTGRAAAARRALPGEDDTTQSNDERNAEDDTAARLDGVVTPGRMAIAAGVLIFGGEYVVQHAPPMGAVGLVIAAGVWLVMGLGVRVILRGFDRPGDTDRTRDGRRDRDGDAGHGATGPREKLAGVALWMIGGAAGVAMFPMIGVWAIGAAGFVAVSAAVTHGLRRVEVGDGGRGHGVMWVAAGLFAAAVALLLHGQIEMTLVQPSSAPLAMVVLGLAAACGARCIAQRDARRGGATDAMRDTDAPRTDADATPAGPTSPARVPLITASIASAAMLVVLLIAHVRPVLAHESLLADAADHLRGGRLDVAGALLTQAALGRDTAAPPDDRVARDAARLLFEKGRHDAAYAVLDDARTRGHRLAQLHTTEARLAEARFRHTADPADLRRAYHAAAAGLDHAPYDMELTRHAADLAYELAARTDARRLYTRLLELSDQAYLDPLKPLDESERTAIRQRLDALEAAATPRP